MTETLKSSGTHMVNCSMFLSQFTLTSGTPKTYYDKRTDSGTTLGRHFCGDCRSNLFATTPVIEEILVLFSGSVDQAATWWKPNKEQYLETKSHWLPDLPLVEKKGIEEKHARGPPYHQFKI